MNDTIQVDLPVRLHEQMRTLVEEGWFQDESGLLVEALRRFLETHRSELMERFIREDVEWGLPGKDFRGVNVEDCQRGEA